MKKDEFEELKDEVRGCIEQWKHDGVEKQYIIHRVIGYLTGSVGTEYERTYTERQLKELLDLAY